MFGPIGLHHIDQTREGVDSRRNQPGILLGEGLRHVTLPHPGSDVNVPAIRSQLSRRALGQ
jgi:hypothetical protein